MISNRNNNDNNVRIRLIEKIETLEKKIEEEVEECIGDFRKYRNRIKILQGQLRSIENQMTPESKKSSGAELLASRQPRLPSTRNTVVLDGSNIVHGGAEGQNIVIRRLTSAIAFYESKGYHVITILRTVTFNHIKWKSLPDLELLNDLRDRDKLHLADEDDLVVIDIALKEDAWIITQDTFNNDKQKDSETILCERKQYPDLPWGDIDERTRGTEKLGNGKIISGQHWTIVGENFSDPSIPESALPIGLNLELRERARELSIALDRYYQELVRNRESNPDLNMQKSNVIQARECMENITQSFQFGEE